MRRTFAVLATLASASLATAQLVVGVDNTSTNIEIYDFSTNSYLTPFSVGIGIRGMAADDANRLLYFTSGSRLYSVAYDEPHTLTDIAAFNGAVTSISGGLAFNPNTGLLIASTTSSFYSVDPATATTTLLWSVGAGDFGGLDYDASTGKLYATNDSTSTSGGLTGRGLYEIDLSVPSAVEVVDYPEKTPGTPDTDIDGMAAANGKLYPCADETNWAYIYNLGTPGYETPIAQPFGTDKVFSGATWAPGILVGLDFDVRVSKTAAVGCPLGVGDTVTYTIAVKNNGTVDVTGVTVTDTLPAEVDFVSVDPPGSHSAGVITANIGTLTGGQVVSFNVVVTVNSVGAIANTADVTLNETDPVLTNNTSTATVNVLDTSRVATGVYSNIATAANSDVPGIPGAKFENFDRPYLSPSGNYWVFSGDTNGATTVDEFILRSDFSSGTVIVQEGTTATTDADLVGLVDQKLSVNDSGDVAFATNTDAATASDEILAVWSGGTVTAVAREGNQVPGMAVGVLYGIDLHSANLFANGKTGFTGSIAGAATGSAVFADNGETVIAQSGVTVPAGQAGGATETWETFDSGDTFFNFDGSHHMMEGNLTGATTGDDAAAVDGTIVVQEGSIVPGSGFSSPADQATPLDQVNMQADGTWFARGDNDDDQDWVLKNGAVIAKSGDPIVTPSTGETWGDSSFAATFFLNLSNANGDTVVGGVTDAADDLANAVLVLNGTTVISRENDPVDVNGDGTFNDDTYIRTYGNDDVIMTNDAVYVVVTLRNSDGYCGGGNADIGDAIVRIPLPGGAPCEPCDTNCDGSINGQDIGGFIDALSGNPDPCSPCNSDADGNGSVNGQDIDEFIACLAP